MHLHYHHHYLLDWYPGKNNLSATHNQKYIKLIMPLQLMWLQHTIRDSPFHTHWTRNREMGPHLSELEVEKDRPGKGRTDGKEKCSCIRRQTWKGETTFFMAASSRRILVRTGPKWNGELLYILTLQGTGANSSPIYLWKLQNQEHHKINMESFCVTKKRPTRSEKTKPQTSNR